jgi:iron complex outermembrane receptor protein
MNRADGSVTAVSFSQRLIPAFVAATLATSAAQAQQAAASAEIEEIIVTATKREESLQTVPVAVSVLSGAELQQANLNAMESISTRIPTVNFRANASNKDTSLFIRGVGTITTSQGAEPSVSTVVDGVVFGRAGMATTDLMDVARLEVLRGPQGTLFGKNASAGVINIVSKPIAEETQGFVDLGWFEGNEQRIRAGVSGGLSETVKGSLNAMYGDFDGVVRNTFLREDVQGYERQGVRGKLEIAPSEDVDVTLIADYMESKDTNTRGPWFLPSAAVRAAIAPIEAGVENREVSTDVLERVDDENWGLSGQVDWDVAIGSVTSITAYRKWDNTQYQDIDGTAQVYNQIAQLSDKGVVEYDQFSQELRLASPGGQFFDFVVGAFWYDSQSDEVYRRDRVQCNGTLPNLPNGLTPCAALTTGYGEAKYGSELQSWSLFGEGTLNFTDTLRGIVGLRYTDDTLHFYHQRFSTFPAFVGGIRPTKALVRGQTDEDGFSGRLGMQFDVNDDVMTYLTFSRGYKGPAYNVFFNLQYFDEEPLAKETSDSWEIGLKSMLFDNQLRFNVALFDTQFSGYQANYPDVVGGVTVTRLINAGDVSTQGAEVDFQAVITEDLSLVGAIAYTDAQVDKFRCPQGITCPQLNGEQLPFAPEWKVVVGANYGMDVGSDLRLDFGLDVRYQDDTRYDLALNTPTADYIEPSWAVIDASIALSPANERWRVAVLGKNLTDESYSTNRLNGVQRGVPRDDEMYWGMTARWNF